MIILFDIDGTLTPSGGMIKPEMVEVIEKLSQVENILLGLVGGGTIVKIKQQMGPTMEFFHFVFTECGSVIYIDGELVSEKNMLDECDRPILNLIIKTALKNISEMPIVYHGHQIDFRKGLIYISPPGIQATDYERNIFMEMDTKLDLRKKLLLELQAVDPEKNFDISFGGSVGLAVCPKGWDKSQVISYLVERGISDSIYYFGDKTEPGGNDYPIYSHQLVKGVSVRDYLDTIEKINKLFL